MGSLESPNEEETKLQFKDFMPFDQHGKPVHESKPGSLHFHCNLGSCFDSLIEEQVNSFVPKHKSWLKPSDLAFVAKKD